MSAYPLAGGDEWADITPPTGRYDGRLGSHASCAERATPLGTGLRFLGVEHEGSSTSSEEEAERIRLEIERLVASSSWLSKTGAR